MSKLFAHHSETDTCYTLTEDAEKVFEAITDKYNGQFNLKYSTPWLAILLLPNIMELEAFSLCYFYQSSEWSPMGQKGTGPKFVTRPVCVSS